MNGHLHLSVWQVFPISYFAKKIKRKHHRSYRLATLMIMGNISFGHLYFLLLPLSYISFVKVLNLLIRYFIYFSLLLSWSFLKIFINLFPYQLHLFLSSFTQILHHMHFFSFDQLFSFSPRFLVILMLHFSSFNITLNSFRWWGSYSGECSLPLNCH